MVNNQHYRVKVNFVSVVGQYDTNGDGLADTIAVDVTGDGQANVQGYAVDTTGDFNVDSVAVDTTGDGLVDSVIQITAGDCQNEFVAKCVLQKDEYGCFFLAISLPATARQTITADVLIEAVEAWGHELAETQAMGVNWSSVVDFEITAAKVGKAGGTKLVRDAAGVSPRFARSARRSEHNVTADHADQNTLPPCS